MYYSKLPLDFVVRNNMLNHSKTHGKINVPINRVKVHPFVLREEAAVTVFCALLGAVNKLNLSDSFVVQDNT